MKVRQHLKVAALLYLPLILILGCSGSKRTSEEASWCDHPLREQFSQLKEVSTSSNWFKVYLVGTNVYAIAEPYNFQEVISYLILGTESALLFDTGMGLTPIRKVVEELTDLPLSVLNSHTHYDHIGGNHEFDQVMAMNLPYTKDRASKGMEHQKVKHETSLSALCQDKLQGTNLQSYHIKPFQISTYIADGSIISLGNRDLEVIAVPGHTPDAIALLDNQEGYLWTGDTFYEAPIWLFDPETNLTDYGKSIAKLAKLSPRLKKIFTAHNTPVAAPRRLLELVKAYRSVINGEAEEKKPASEDQTAEYEFEHFSFVIRRSLLPINQ